MMDHMAAGGDCDSPTPLRKGAQPFLDFFFEIFHSHPLSHVRLSGGNKKTLSTDLPPKSIEQGFGEEGGFRELVFGVRGYHELSLHFFREIASQEKGPFVEKARIGLCQSLSKGLQIRKCSKALGVKLFDPVPHPFRPLLRRWVSKTESFHVDEMTD